MKHHYRALGGWTFAFKPYYEQNLTVELDNPRTQQLADLVDPYSKKNNVSLYLFNVTFNKSILLFLLQSL